MNISRWNSSKLGVFYLLTGLLGICGNVPVKAQKAGNIAQDTALYSFFAALDKADSTVISILHLGDSHIQAGFYPAATATYLQQDFGSAGRGWVFPYNLAGTNGPDDYRWNSTGRWQAARIVDRYKNDPLGPGAIVITSQNNAPTLAFNGRRESGADNSIRQATLFYDAGVDDTSISVPGADVTVSATPFPDAGQTLRKATLEFPDAVQSFQARWEEKGAKPFRFYGALLQNGDNGILYNAIGINGAMFQHYNELNSTLVAQLEVLQPQLVIISLGTNEAYGNLNIRQFHDQIDSTVQLIRRNHPQAAIMLTTPPECKRVSRKPYRKKTGKQYKTYYRITYYPNPYIAVVTKQIMNYCRENGLACWDFNAVNRSMSGSFAGAWATDHIHFNARGYQLQGKLLYEALHQSYKNYLEKLKS